MLMIDPKYEGFFGSIDSSGDGSTKTLFYHFCGVPLFPRRSYHVLSSGLFSRDHQVIELATRCRRSVLVAYATWWPLMAALWLLLFAGLQAGIPDKAPVIEGDPMIFGQVITFWICLVVGTAALVAGILGRVILGRQLSPDELARRSVFARFLGTRLDPAQMRSTQSLCSDLQSAMAAIAERAGWKRAYDQWAEIAMLPQVTDPQYLAMAATVSRLLSGPASDAPVGGHMAQVHEAVWRKLLAVDPQLTVARA